MAYIAITAMIPRIPMILKKMETKTRPNILLFSFLVCVSVLVSHHQCRSNQLRQTEREKVSLPVSGVKLRCLKGESLLLVSFERYLIVLKHCLQTYEKTRMLTAPFGLPVSSVFGLPFECFNPLHLNEWSRLKPSNEGLYKQKYQQYFCFLGQRTSSCPLTKEANSLNALMTLRRFIQPKLVIKTNL